MYEVIETRPHKYGGKVILCRLPGNDCTPFVTWRVSEKWPGRDTKTEGRFWGHYAKDIGEAQRDFRTR